MWTVESAFVQQSSVEILGSDIPSAVDGTTSKMTLGSVGHALEIQKWKFLATEHIVDRGGTVGPE